MPEIKTEISEIVTGLGMTGLPSIAVALSSRPDAVVNVPDGVWARVAVAYAAGDHGELFDAAWENGVAFLDATDGLRHRRPTRIEWKGPSRPVGYEAIPADLRVDHVYLVSCKHLSRVLHNVAPSYLFDRALIVRRGVTPPADWYAVVAPVAYQELYGIVRAHLDDASLPNRVTDLTGVQRRVIRDALGRGRWPVPMRPAAAAFAYEVASVSAARWRGQLASRNAAEEQLWRLLRHASAPYFVLGASATDPLRLRVATPWDWRQSFEFRSFDVSADATAVQPVVHWRATVRRRSDGRDLVVSGYVEIRWSHGKFCQPPEAKVQLVTKHEDVPGYFPLT